jgi:hypothetical protein
MIEFRLKHHLVKIGVPVCEVWVDGEFKATINPDGAGTGIHITTRHMEGQPQLASFPDGVTCMEIKFVAAEQTDKPFILRLNDLLRWIILSRDSPNLAWSGSRWVPHHQGIPTGNVQICNFETRDEAQAYVDENFNAFYPPPPTL